MAGYKILIALAVVASFAVLAQAKKCYVCTTNDLSQCAQAECEGKCVKYEVGSSVARTCGKETCPTGTGYYCCDSNLCNSSTGVVASIMTVTISLTALLF